ncbi:MAG: NADH-quinone oxidoreductase subunit N [Verrucomicrobia bacterium]|nr:MAG: NADH-quinone oxidoreductase subunit N [Verrucomicrobiota bacterium]
MSYLSILNLAAPETIMVMTALAVLAADLLFMRELERGTRQLIGAMIGCAGCLAAVAWMLVLPLPEPGSLMQGLFLVDPLIRIVKVALLALTIFTVLISMEADFTQHIGEYFALILFAAIGMMFLVSTEDILMIFISLELTSLSLYILTAFNKRNIKSAEAALKYFLFGGMAAAFTLFGLSLLYGISGSTNLAEIAKAVSGKSVNGLDPLLIAAIVLTVIGFGFKVAAVPFHLWAPDAYEGAPIPSAAFIASGSKVASFFVFAKVMMIGFKGAEGSGSLQAWMPGWVPTLAVVAAASMVLGNLAAIAQSSVRRLLAYSAIAHAGYVLLAVMAVPSPLAPHTSPLGPLVYYVITYGLTTLGAFAVVSNVQQRTGGDRLSDFAGLARRAPLLSFCMLIFMLSLAGIPPLAGFFGKFYVFTAALSSGGKSLGLLWLVILAVAMSAVSLYYYLLVLKQIYIMPSTDQDTPRPLSIGSQAIVFALAALVLILGCAPGLILEPVMSAIKVAGL